MDKKTRKSNTWVFFILVVMVISAQQIQAELVSVGIGLVLFGGLTLVATIYGRKLDKRWEKKRKHAQTTGNVKTAYLDDPVFHVYNRLDNTTAVISLDFHLAVTLSAIRMAADLFLMLNIIVKFRTAYEEPGSKLFRRRRLIDDTRAIAVKYLRRNFIFDLLAALPLPQAYLWYQISTHTRDMGTTMKNSHLYYDLLDILVVQFPPRFYVLINSRTEVTKRAGILMASGMSGAFYNLLWFVNLSNYLGAIYYTFHINWLKECKNIVHEKDLETKFFEWDQLLSSCTENNVLEQGMFSGSLTNKIGTRNFIQNYMFCFSWGLKSLSSLGQNFTTSYSTLETTISIVVTLYGLILLADLITRMQAGIQSMEEKEEQQRARQREVKEWMDYHQLPVDLKERVDHSIQSEWTENVIDDEVMLESLPIDIRSEIRKYLYLDSVSKLPKFSNMDGPLVEFICQYLKTFSGKKGTYIVYEGELVKQMLFIFNGKLELSFTDRGNSNITVLEPGDCCGQELVTWASQPSTSMDSLPTSSWTIKCLTDVEAFVLQAYDMKILATQFAHNQDFQRAFKQHYP